MPANRFEYFELILKNSFSGKMRDVRFNIEPTALAQRWAGMLQDLLRSKSYLEKNYLFHGWISGARDLEFLCAELNKNIDIINQYFSRPRRGLRYHISQTFASHSVDQEELNKIHHDFVVLIGQVMKSSPYYKIAPPPVRRAIQQLNNYCHEIENFIESRESLRRGRCGSYLFAAMSPKAYSPLTREETKQFRLFFNFGDVRLHYAQLGINYLEAYFSREHSLYEEDIVELQHMTGEFDIVLSDGWTEEGAKLEEASFKEWLRAKNADPEGDYGFPLVAQLDREGFGDASSLEILQGLFNYDDVCAIRLVGQGRTVTKEYLQYEEERPGFIRKILNRLIFW